MSVLHLSWSDDGRRGSLVGRSNDRVGLCRKTKSVNVRELIEGACRGRT